MTSPDLCACGDLRSEHFREMGVCWAPGCPCVGFRRPRATKTGRAKPKRPMGRKRPATAPKNRGRSAAFWARRRREAIRKRLGWVLLCEVCARPLEGQCEVAHFHPLGRARSRRDPDAYCSVCDIRLNDIENLRIVCLSLKALPAGAARSCHAEIDRQFAESGGCTQERRHGKECDDDPPRQDDHGH